MALFNKKLSLEDILKAIQGLSDDEKAQLKAKMDESAPVENEPMEEEQVDNETPEVESEQPETTEEVGEEPVEEPQEGIEQPVGESVEPNVETPVATEELNGIEQKNKDDVIQGLMDRLQALEEKLSEFDELKALMEKFTKKQADNFGYKGQVPGAKKDIHEMSANELKQKMLNGEI